MIQVIVKNHYAKIEAGITNTIVDNGVIACGRTIIHTRQTLADSPLVGA